MELKEKSRKIPRINESLETAEGRGIPEWVTVDKTGYKSTVNRLPARDDIAYDIHEHLIVELYSK